MYQPISGPNNAHVQPSAAKLPTPKPIVDRSPSFVVDDSLSPSADQDDGLRSSTVKDGEKESISSSLITKSSADDGGGKENADADTSKLQPPVVDGEVDVDTDTEELEPGVGEEKCRLLGLDGTLISEMETAKAIW